MGKNSYEHRTYESVEVRSLSNGARTDKAGLPR